MSPYVVCPISTRIVAPLCRLTTAFSKGDAFRLQKPQPGLNVRAMSHAALVLWDDWLQAVHHVPSESRVQLR